MSQPVGSQPRYNHTASPIGADGVIRCPTHNFPVATRTAKTDDNFNRKFYCCGLDIDNLARCKFFRWADDPIFDELRGSSSQGGTGTPSSSQPLRQPAPFPSSQGKRTHSPLPSTPSQSQPQPMQRTPSSQTRLQAIQAAQAAMSPPTPSAQSSSQQTIRVTPNAPAELPRSPSKRPHYASVTSTTTSELFQSLNSPDSSDQSFSDLDSLPVYTASTRTHYSTFVIFCSIEFKGSEGQDPPVTTDAHGNEEVTSTIISNYIQTLSVIPTHVKKLEQKVRVLENNVQAKSKRIKVLEKDILSMVSRNRELEEEICALKANKR